MGPKTKGLLSFALGGVIIIYILMSLLSENILLTHMRIFILVGAFIGFLLLGYGLMLIVKEMSPISM